MAEATSLFHCVCGADIPFAEGGEIALQRAIHRLWPRCEIVALSEKIVPRRLRLRPGAHRRGAGPARRALTFFP